MIESILPNLFIIQIPLPQSPLKSLNSIVIKGPDRNLIVDTGMNRSHCLAAMLSGLAELAVDLEKTDFFLTHNHSDHFGLISHLASDSSTIYMGQDDIERIAAPNSGRQFLDTAVANGFPGEDAKAALDGHPGFRFGPDRMMTYTAVQDGDRIEAGDYVFTCVATPGHTFGHTCLYESGHRVLVSGDHILGDITPNIQAWRKWNPLKAYLASLDKVESLDVRLTLPGHRALVSDCRARIDELRRHHEGRVVEVLEILSEGAQNAFQVASRMTWDIECSSWEDFPLSQKWFAVGEANAHLVYLKDDGRIVATVEGEQISYSLRR
jgi:glyoxylase-like metal-dependent hydrolase (beta-lactamase superfamily II)